MDLERLERLTAQGDLDATRSLGRVAARMRDHATARRCLQQLVDHGVELHLDVEGVDHPLTFTAWLDLDGLYTPLSIVDPITWPLQLNHALLANIAHQLLNRGLRLFPTRVGRDLHPLLSEACLQLAKDPFDLSLQPIHEAIVERIHADPINPAQFCVHVAFHALVGDLTRSFLERTWRVAAKVREACVQDVNIHYPNYDGVGVYLTELQWQADVMAFHCVSDQPTS